MEIEFINMEDYDVMWVSDDLVIRWRDDYDLLGLRKAVQFGYTICLVSDDDSHYFVGGTDIFSVEMDDQDFCLVPVYLIEDQRAL